MPAFKYKNNVQKRLLKISKVKNSSRFGKALIRFFGEYVDKELDSVKRGITSTGVSITKNDKLSFEDIFTGIQINRKLFLRSKYGDRVLKNPATYTLIENAFNSSQEEGEAILTVVFMPIMLLAESMARTLPTGRDNSITPFLMTLSKTKVVNEMDLAIKDFADMIDPLSKITKKGSLKGLTRMKVLRAYRTVFIREVLPYFEDNT